MDISKLLKYTLVRLKTNFWSKKVFWIKKKYWKIYFEIKSFHALMKGKKTFSSNKKIKSMWKKNVLPLYLESLTIRINGHTTWQYLYYIYIYIYIYIYRIYFILYVHCTSTIAKKSLQLCVYIIYTFTPQVYMHFFKIMNSILQRQNSAKDKISMVFLALLKFTYLKVHKLIQNVRR